MEMRHDVPHLGKSLEFTLWRREERFDTAYTLMRRKTLSGSTFPNIPNIPVERKLAADFGITAVRGRAHSCSSFLGGMRRFALATRVSQSMQMNVTGLVASRKAHLLLCRDI
jgi:hypothetical protein